MKYLFSVILMVMSGFSGFAAVTLPAQAGDFSWDRPHTEENRFRQTICLNGLWRFLPLAEAKLSEQIPTDDAAWGWFKVPGVWPQYAAANNPIQPLLSEAQMKQVGQWHSAWYQRAFTVPETARGRRICLDIEHVQTRARVFVDGRAVGSIDFPGGELDLAPAIKFGQKQTLSILVSAIPSVNNDYIIMDTHNVFKVAAKVKIKGIVGDVFLHTVPAARIDNTHFITSVRNQSIRFDCGLSGLAPSRRYRIEAVISKDGKTVKTFDSGEFDSTALKDGRFGFSAPWRDPELWDLNTPRNIYHGVLTLRSGNQVVDCTLPEKFGFREFRVEGQNYLLNGTPVHLMAYCLGTYGNFWAADKSSEEACMTTFRRLRSLGFNFFIASNYNFNEGSTSYIRGTYEAADRSGFLGSLSLPHPRKFDWKLDDPETGRKYERLTAYLIRKYWNHPSLVMFAAAHNSTSAWGDQNPLRLGQEYSPADSKEERELKELHRKNAVLSMTCANRIDPSRPAYAHASGNLGGHYTLNMYLNWAPLQERSDWLEDYCRRGRYPLDLVEWGLPHIASFSSFRGPGFIWRVKARQTVWDAEYMAAYRGDAAAVWTPDRLQVLDRLIKFGNEPFEWTKIYYSLKELKGIRQLQADFYEDNLRSMRAWNVSMLLPWDDYANYSRVPGKYPPVENPTRFRNLNRPGIVPDFFRQDSYVYTPYEKSFKLSPLGMVIRRWTRPLIAFIGGAKVFTSKEHIYYPGETVEKQLVIVSDLRSVQVCEYEIWGKNISVRSVKGQVRVAPGTRATVLVRLRLPDNLAPGKYQLQSKYSFSNGEKRWDRFDIEVVPRPAAIKPAAAGLALYDPKGLTAAELDRLGVPYRRVGVGEDMSRYRTLIIGREALTPTGKLPELGAVKSGLNVLVFEQRGDALNRLGFRTNEHGLRTLFVRDAHHPALRGLNDRLLSNWRGESTLLPPYLDYNGFFAPTWRWCGFENTRVWRCGNRGNLAGVLIEKPPVGDFRPLLDGGFALQYAPLLEYREGRGTVVFCQVEVTARTEREPAAGMLTLNLLKYIAAPPERPRRKVFVRGGKAFLTLIDRLRIDCRSGDAGDAAGTLWVIGPGADGTDLSAELQRGATVLCVGVGEATLKRIYPALKPVQRRNAPSAPVDLSSAVFAGISNFDTYFQTRLDYDCASAPGGQLQVIPCGKGQLVVCSVAPGALAYESLFRLRSSYRRRVFLLSRLLHNLGAEGSSVLLPRFASPPEARPWTGSFYLQEPVAEDDPYRYYHW